MSVFQISLLQSRAQMRSIPMSNAVWAFELLGPLRDLVEDLAK